MGFLQKPGKVCMTHQRLTQVHIARWGPGSWEILENFDTIPIADWLIHELGSGWSIGLVKVGSLFIVK